MRDKLKVREPTRLSTFCDFVTITPSDKMTVATVNQPLSDGYQLRGSTTFRGKAAVRFLR